jgi:hypothetical protein
MNDFATELRHDGAVEESKANRAEAEIEKFCTAMRNEALSNAHKGHWSDNGQTAEDHVKEAMYHGAKLLVAILHGDKDAVLEYAADVANHAMFSADMMEALDAKLSLKPAEGVEYGDGVPWAKQNPDLKAFVYGQFEELLVRAKAIKETTP